MPPMDTTCPRWEAHAADVAATEGVQEIVMNWYVEYTYCLVSEHTYPWIGYDAGRREVAAWGRCREAPGTYPGAGGYMVVAPGSRALAAVAATEPEWVAIARIERTAAIAAAPRLVDLWRSALDARAVYLEWEARWPTEIVFRGRYSDTRGPMFADMGDVYAARGAADTALAEALAAAEWGAHPGGGFVTRQRINWDGGYSVELHVGRAPVARVVDETRGSRPRLVELRSLADGEALRREQRARQREGEARYARARLAVAMAIVDGSPVEYQDGQEGGTATIVRGGERITVSRRGAERMAAELRLDAEEPTARPRDRARRPSQVRRVGATPVAS